MPANKVREEIIDGWRHLIYDDGNELVQHYYHDKATEFCIERVVKPGSRRRNWVVTDRNDRKHFYNLYPPKVAGPFPDLDSAKAALRLINSSVKE